MKPFQVVTVFFCHAIVATFEDPRNCHTSTSEDERPAKVKQGEKLQFDAAFQVANP